MSSYYGSEYIKQQGDVSCMPGSNRLLVVDTSPFEGPLAFSEGEVLDDLATTKHETIGKSSINPIGRVFQADVNVEVHDDFIFISQELLRVARPFGPSPTSLRDVLLHFRDATIGAGRWKALGLNAHNLRIKIVSHGLHVIAIDRIKELLERFGFGTYGSHSSF